MDRRMRYGPKKRSSLQKAAVDSTKAGELMRQLWSMVALVVVLVILPSAARSELTQFIPRLYDFEGLLELNGLKDSTKNKTDGNGLTSSDTSFEEKLTLSTVGFIYHPRFILLSLMVSGIMGQEKFNTGTGNASWTNLVSIGHEVHIKILPEHPYNLELYSIQDTTYAPGGTQSGQITTDQNGAVFTYYEEPFSANASYSITNTKSDRLSNDITSLIVNGSHAIPLSTTTAVYSHFTTDTTFPAVSMSSNTATTKDIYSLSNTLKYEELTLSSNANLTLSDQTSNPFVIDTSSKFLIWSESLNYQLPWNFYSSMIMNHFNTSMSTTSNGVQSTESTTSNNESFNLGHQLFQSLSSNYNLSISDSKSSDMAKDATVTQTLTFNYTKKIPFGLLSIGLLGADLAEKRNGALEVINESHTAKLLAPANMFTLNNASADIATIIVNVLVPGTQVEYELPQMYYTIGMLGNSPLITIIDLPLINPPVKQPDPNFTYAFTISYSLAPDNVELDTIQKGYTLQFNLFNGLLGPYYRYLSSHQTVVSGILNGGPNSSQSRSIGITATRQPFTFLADYTKVTSTLLDSTQFTSQLFFSKEILDNTTISMNLRYVKARYINSGLSATALSYTEEDKTVTAALSRVFPYNISTTLTGSYGTSRSLTNSNMITANGELMWRTGKLNLSAGATLSNSATTFSGASAGLAAGKTVMDHQYYYLRIQRRLF